MNKAKQQAMHDIRAELALEKKKPIPFREDLNPVIRCLTRQHIAAQRALSHKSRRRGG